MLVNLAEANYAPWTKWVELEALTSDALLPVHVAYSTCTLYLVKVPHSDERSEVLIISNSDDNVACLQLIEVLYTLTICLE